MDLYNISGEQINYYFICKTKLWLFSHKIEMEHSSDLVYLGKVLDETTYKRDKHNFIIDNKIQIDFIRSNDIIELHEVKSSPNMDVAHKFQLLYYMYYLNKVKNIENIVGYLNYPKLRKKEKIILNNKIIQKLEYILEDIIKIINSEIPKPKKSKICRKCAYFEFCFI